MTDEELAAIRERVDRAYRAALVKPDADWPVPMMALWYSNDGNALLAEVERLRAREAALREIAQEVAFATAIAPSETRSYLVLHDPDKADALLAKARALLNPKVQPDL